MKENIPHICFISYGSNQGNRLKNISNALKETEKKIGKITLISHVYETDSWGFDSDKFYNGCFRLETKLSAEKVLKKLLKIENEYGRQRDSSKKYSPRFIDLDLLFFDDLIVKKNNIILPHPKIHIRNFVLAPLCEIAPDYIHPYFKLAIKEIYSKSKDLLKVRKLNKLDYNNCFPIYCS